MLQRVGLAQALVNDPEIVFLDEPMSGLDPIGRREVRDLIASLRAKGKTVFMCSHILSDIEVLCDRVAILNRGRLSETGRLEELRERAGDPHRIEITVAGTDADKLSSVLPSSMARRLPPRRAERASKSQTERDVDAALAALRRAGGRLVSVQPVRQSLEELFVREVADSQGDSGGKNN